MSWTFIASAKGENNGSGTTLDASSALNVQEGDLLVAFSTWEGSTTTVGVAKSTGSPANTFTTDAADKQDGGGFWEQFSYVLAASADASMTVRATWSAARDFRKLFVFQFRPTTGATVTKDTSNKATGSGATSNSGNITTTGTDEIVIGGVTTFDGGTTSAEAIGGTTATGVLRSATGAAAAIWYRILSATMTNGAATATGPNTSWAAGIIAFKATLVGGIASAAGTGAASGVGASLAASVGSAAGTSSATGATNQAIASSAGTSTAAAVGARVLSSPPIIQHHSSAHNPQSSTSQTGDLLKIAMKYPVGAGNCLVLKLLWNTSVAAPTVSDNINGTWPSPTVNQAGAGFDMGVWVLPNAGAGQTLITVDWTSAIQPFQYEITELARIATSSTVAGSASATADTGPSVTSGSVTPTNNDATGGNFLMCFAHPDELASRAGLTSAPQSVTPSSGFELLSVGLDGVDDDILPRAVSYMHQATAAAISPGFTFTSDSGNTYMCAVIALKVDMSAGTVPPAGAVRIVGTAYRSFKSFPTGATNHPQQFPTRGDCQAVFCHPDDPIVNLDSITDTDGNTWTQHEENEGESQVHVAEHVTPNPNNVLTLHVGAGNPGVRYTIFFYDLVNAEFDTFNSNAAADCSSVTTINNCPSITPNVAPGVSIAYVDLGLGPATGLAAGAPSGAVFHAPIYTGETDSDYLTNAAGLAHLYYSTTAQQNWNWTITSIPNNSSYPVAACFKQAGAAAGSEASAGGTSAASGVGSSLAASAASTAGTGAASGTATSTAQAVGAAAGSSTAIALTGIVALASGSAAALGVGRALVAGVAAASGSSAAAAEGNSAATASVASASGVALALALGGSVARATALAAGQSNVTGLSSELAPIFHRPGETSGGTRNLSPRGTTRRL